MLLGPFYLLLFILVFILGKMSGDSKLPVSTNLMTMLNDETGLIEVIDIVTGRVLAVQRTPEDLFETKKNLVQIFIDGKEVWYEEGINPDTLRPNKLQFSWTLADVICQLIQEGKTFKDICSRPGFPSYSLLCRWRREFPEFAQNLKQARVDRAEYMVAEALEIVECSGSSSDELNHSKARSEMRKWLASKDSPTHYGNKVEVSGDNPVTFILETGIRRSDDEGFKTDETAKIKDVESSSSNE